MKKGLLLPLYFISAVVFLLSGFYRNRWGLVEAEKYENWQAIFDRTVVARLVQTRQAGFLSAGGLLGLGDVTVWDFGSKTNRRQYEAYLNGGSFQTFLSYNSTPGGPGILYGILDQVPGVPENTKLKLFRGGTALASAMVLSLISVWLVMEFGWLAGLLPILLAGLADGLIRPAGSMYWNLWVFYLPPVAATFLLAKSDKGPAYPAKRLLWISFWLCLLKVLMTGFEGITTVMVMTTVPFVYFSLRDRWGWRLFLERTFKLGLVLCAAVVAGVVILMLQVAIAQGSYAESVDYIWSALNRRAIGNPQQYGGLLAESMSASVFEVIWTYFILDNVTFPLGGQTLHIPFWYTHALIAFFTLVYILKNGAGKRPLPSTKGWSLIVTTWYSVLAPISWYVVFKPNAYLHTSIYVMLWHMPFTLLGFALCGYVIADLFKQKPT